MIFSNENQNDLLDYFNISNKYENTPINRLLDKKKVNDKGSLLNTLRKKIEKVSNCELKNNAKNLVFSDGDKNSPIMIVGEGPGQKEDELSKPFVGDAGNLLNKMFDAIDIPRKNLYITNVVNYRPPKNRKPKESEIIKYSVFLKEHIFIVNPKILVLMGSTAMEALLKLDLKISRVRGKWNNVIIKNKNFKTLVTFHPAYLLRQPDKKKFSWEDLKIIKKEIINLGIQFK